ncbi:rhodanese-like domain-containing protein [Desulfitobacterium sp.]|uniref:rhodanese-like domain-containing protein n=1 Tax=Desulfitobacterium sp. TaxID=49981 RepID=UPI002D7FCD60|nr:rhodanese-like domain-containing protein [Desulfitobacterium sp.]
MSVRSKGLTFIYLLLLGFSMILLPGCGNSPTVVQDPPKANSSQANVNQNAADMIPATAKLSTDDLDTAIKDNKGWQLIDIRESREFAAGHIKMAINRPLGDLEKNLAQISKDKDIVLIDLNGTRSESAWQVLVKKGYDQNKIKVLTGGMLRWNGIVSSAGSNSTDNTNTSGNNAAAPKPEVQGVVGGC